MTTPRRSGETSSGRQIENDGSHAERSEQRLPSPDSANSGRKNKVTIIVPNHESIDDTSTLPETPPTTEGNGPLACGFLDRDGCSRRPTRHRSTNSPIATAKPAERHRVIDKPNSENHDHRPSPTYNGNRKSV